MGQFSKSFISAFQVSFTTDDPRWHTRHAASFDNLVLLPSKSLSLLRKRSATKISKMQAYLINIIIDFEYRFHFIYGHFV